MSFSRLIAQLWVLCLHGHISVEKCTETVLVRSFYSPASPLPLNVTQVCAELVVLVLQVVVSSGLIVVYLACGLYCLCSGPQDGRMGLD